MEAASPPGSSKYFHIRIVRSRPAEAMWEGDIHFAALMEEVCPPLPADEDVASTSDDILHTLKRLS